MFGARGRGQSWTPIPAPSVYVRPARCNNAAGTHVDFAHDGKVDRCLCGRVEKRCKGDCGLDDMSWLPLKRGQE